jgi:hypothetical protein
LEENSAKGFFLLHQVNTMISSFLKPGDFIGITSLISTSQYSLLPELEQILIEAADNPDEYHLVSISKQPLMMFVQRKEANINESKPYSIDKKDKMLVLINNRLFYIYDEKTLYFGKLDLDI